MPARSLPHPWKLGDWNGDSARASSQLSSLLQHVAKRFDLGALLNGGGDPRSGSARDGSSGGTVSTATNSKSSSLAKLGATFIPVAIFLAVVSLLFIVLRKKCPRIFSPRSVPGLVTPLRPVKALPNGWINWVKPFFKTPDSIALESGSLDGYFFLRYLKTLRNICLVGCCIVWPVLLPINATGGVGSVELDMLTMGNVKSAKKFYAHALAALVFFGFVLYMIVRECIWYINLRQAYLSSPHFSEKLSSRTVLLTSVPKPYLDETRLKRVYGDSVRRIWIPKTSKPLANLVKEREQTADRLEKAEVLLIKKANAAREKMLKQDRKNGLPQADLYDAKPLPQQLPSPVPPVTPVKQEQDQDQDQDQAKRQSKRDTQTKVVNVSTSSLPSTDRTSESQPQLEIDEIEDTIRIVQMMDVPGFKYSTPPSTSLDLSREQYDIPSLDSPFHPEDEMVTPVPRPKRKPMIDHPDDPEYMYPYGLSSKIPDLRGSVAAQYIGAQARPHHRPVGNWLRRVDTIRWTRSRLQELNLQIYKLRKSIRSGKLAVDSRLPAAFIEFETQEAAQAAHQVVAHHRPLQMSTRLLGVRPDEVVWSTLRMLWWERIIRRTLAMGLITAMVIFWSIPCAVIGIISNISLLSGLPFLTWLKLLPTPILSFIEGFVPAIALSLWMALVPAMIRGIAVQAGVPSLVLIELFTQNAYFAFQVVQVFLITTISNAASGALKDILANPASAKDLLAENLPKASNFYLSYILIQCLMSGGFALLHPFELARYVFLNRVSTIPRARYRVWKKLKLINYGGVFPVFTNMGVIAFCYACIAPLVLIFAAGGMAFIHTIWKYNIIYCWDTSMDTKGLFYPRALTQLIIGLYLAEICLVGLFALNTAFGPLLLMVLLFLFSVVIHMSINEAIKPLLQNLPQTLPIEEQIQEEEKAKLDEPQEISGAANDYFNEEQTFGDEDDQIQEESEEESDDDGPRPTGTRAVEGASSIGLAIKEWIKHSTKVKVTEQVESSGLDVVLSKLTSVFSLSSQKKQPSFLVKWLHPEIYEDFVALRKLIPQDFEDAASSVDSSRIRPAERLSEYSPPEIWTPKPKLWIPKDDARVSRQEVDHSGRMVPISDDAAWLDEKGNVYIELESAPISLPRLLL